jgi:hypothetical protein
MYARWFFQLSRGLVYSANKIFIRLVFTMLCDMSHESVYFVRLCPHPKKIHFHLDSTKECSID